MHSRKQLGVSSLGFLMPGWYPVPQNPINPEAGEWPAWARAAAGVGGVGGVVKARYRPTIGEILPMRFKVPTNPVLDYIREGANKETEAALEAMEPGLMGRGGGLGSCCAGCAQSGETVVTSTTNGQVTALPADMVAGLNSDVEGMLAGIGGLGTLLIGLGVGWMVFGQK